MLVALYLATAQAAPDNRLVGFIACLAIAVLVWLAAKRNALVGIALVAAMVWLANGLRTV